MENDEKITAQQFEESIGRLASVMASVGSTAAELYKGVKAFMLSMYEAYRRCKNPRHIRHKQIERARAMMERGQKGK